MLACLVHKDCKDISLRLMELPPGRTRVEAREDARSTLEVERIDAKSKRSHDPFMEVEHQLKQARVVGMKAQAAQIALQTIQTKIQMLRENAEVYIQTHGQHGYNEMIAGLLTRMARMGENDVREVGTTPISVGFSLPSEQLEDRDDDGGNNE
jgi:hypothetical protein